MIKAKSRLYEEKGDKEHNVCFPCRLAYARWLTEWILRIDPNACDELLLIARGRNIEGWRLSEIRRDDYAPNTPGQRQWEMDRKMWQCNRLLQVLKVGRGVGL